MKNSSELRSHLPHPSALDAIRKRLEGAEYLQGPLNSQRRLIADAPNIHISTRMLRSEATAPKESTDILERQVTEVRNLVLEKGEDISTEIGTAPGTSYSFGEEDLFASCDREESEAGQFMALHIKSDEGDLIDFVVNDKGKFSLDIDFRDRKSSDPDSTYPGYRAVSRPFDEMSDEEFEITQFYIKHFLDSNKT